MKLLELPNELLQTMSKFLPRQTIATLCQTSRTGYQLFLPTLYSHIELGHRTQIKQLEQGLLQNAFLRQTLRAHTHTLTLKCRQGGNNSSHYWLFIISTLFVKQLLPNVRQLCFRDFLALSVHKVRRVLLTLPRLSQLHFQYCNLITHNNDDREKEQEMAVLSSSLGQQSSVSTNKASEHLVELNFIWTDFTVDAIQQLLQSMPNLGRVVLGANHNRKPQANDSALHLLTEHCQHIQDLSVSLQQVKEGSLCRVIQSYGPQLRHLSIRCEGSDTLGAISRYTKQLQHLIIRCCNSEGHATAAGFHVMQLLQTCRHLDHLEMVSWPLHDVPSVVLNQIKCKSGTSSSSTYVATPSSSSVNGNHRQYHYCSPHSSSSFIEGVKRTVALDRQDLQEIRRLCL
ncbi:MAG: hypothetical protein EXX96DRAFT_555537 [Benjaminiella poitrasii]|nr:MAG: hypothetical protein EXX96DRAFT_555537 [Benjaminiella poitrasii]